MEVLNTPFEGVIEFRPRVFKDERGFFLETYQQNKLREIGIDYNFVQDNHSRSCRGVLRGLHFQVNYPQGKLVYVPRGEVFDVAVDIRRDSPTYGQWYGTVLSDQKNNFMFIAPGLAHGFCVLSDTADFIYKCTEFYNPADESGIFWNDPDIGIIWPIKDPILSAKDMKLPLFREYKSLVCK
ncbi:MAG: dTDP-4-dehydrorhamnose 3,5-epimerase [bacterium]|jgi:dTDP-4-dehydrorhamnose 3,5-epimerase